MSQISPPVRILLIGAVVFLAAWFTLLRPKAAEVPPLTTSTTTTPVTTSTPQTGLGKAVDAAKAAAGKAVATSTPAAAAPATTTKPDPKTQTPVAAAIPAAALAKLPKDVAGAIESRKVLVLAVLSDDAKRWRPMADDDRYVRNTLTKVNRYDGQVLVKQVSLANLYTYAPLVSDLKVNQTPSVVVVDRKLKASVIPGYVDRVSINQAIADARAASIDPLITDSYLRKANQTCADFNVVGKRWSQPTIPGKKAGRASERRLQKIYDDYIHAIKKLRAPSRWSSLKRQWIAVMRGDAKAYGKYVGATHVDDIAMAATVANGRYTSSWRKLDRRFDKNGVTSCSILRRR